MSSAGRSKKKHQKQGQDDLLVPGQMKLKDAMRLHADPETNPFKPAPRSKRQRTRAEEVEQQYQLVTLTLASYGVLIHIAVCWFAGYGCSDGGF